MATFEERGNKWRAQVWLHAGKGGKPSKSFKTLADARLWATAKERERDLGDVVMLPAKDTIASVIDRMGFNCSKSKAHHLKHIRSDLGHHPLSKLSRSVVCDYITKLGLAPNNARARMSDLASVVSHAKYKLRLAVRLGEITEARIELTKGGIIARAMARTRKTDANEIERIIEGHTYDDRAIDLPDVLEVLTVYPIRVGELCKLRWADIDHVNRTALLRQRKHPDPSVKERNDELVPLLKVGDDIDIYDLIVTKRARFRNHEGPFPYDVSQVSEAMNSARIKAGLQGGFRDNLHVHDLRAHAITRMLKAGIQPMMVMMVSGHKNPTVFFKHYVRFDIEDVRIAMEKQLVGSNLSMIERAKIAGIDLEQLREELRAELRGERRGLRVVA